MKKDSITLPTKFEDFIFTYHSFEEGFCVTIGKGDLNKDNVPVRLHSSCLFSEALNSLDCDCKLQLDAAMELINTEGFGIIVYLYQEGRGQGLNNKFLAMHVQQSDGVDTAEAYKKLNLDLDPRDYTVAIKALNELNVNSKIRIMSNNPRKVKALEANGFTIVSKINLTYPISDKVHSYLKSKKDKLDHEIEGF